MHRPSRPFRADEPAFAPGGRNHLAPLGPWTRALITLGALAVVIGVITVALVPLTTPVSGAPQVRLAQSAADQILPHLVSGGYEPPTTPTPYGTPPPSRTPWPTWAPPTWPPRPTRIPRPREVGPDAQATPVPRTEGMISFGESIIDLQSLSDEPQSVDIRLHSLDQFEDVSLTRHLDAMAAISVELKSEQAIAFSNYAASIRPERALGVLARTTWATGAMGVYEVPQPGTASILPLFAVDVFSHTTIIQMTNTNPDLGDAIHMEANDTDGSIINEWTFWLDPGESGTIDPYARAEFRVLPPVVGDGFIGGVRFAAGQRTSIMAYGDEAEGRGVDAYLARPIDAADKVQYLPQVRANVGGDSLIAVANTTEKPVDVTITYLGATDSPSGARATFTQSFTLGRRYCGLIDLDLARKRGNIAPPALPRGAARDEGFLGPAVIRASAPVLAMVLDQDARPIDGQSSFTVLSSAAYNAYSPSDLGQTWLLPRVYPSIEGRSTEVAVFNPGTSPVTFRVEWGFLPDDLVGTSGPITVAPGQVALVPILAVEGADPQAAIRADGPVAVVAYDGGTYVDRTAYWPLRVTGDLLDGVPTVEAPPTPTPEPGTPPATASGPATRTPTATRTPRTPGDESEIYMPIAACRWARGR
jgi:hypothetical protein